MPNLCFSVTIVEERRDFNLITIIRLKIAIDVDDFISTGSEFHSLVAVGMNELSYKLVRDLGIVKSN